VDSGNASKLAVRHASRMVLRSLLTGAAAFALPQRCGGCLTPGAAWCRNCRQRLPDVALRDVGWTPLHAGLLAVAAFAYADPIAAALKRAKTPGGHGGAAALAYLLWRQLGVHPAALPGVRTWVPSLPAAERSRGRSLPQVLAGDGAVGLLTRVGSPPDQKSLGRRQRRASPHGTFLATQAVPSRVVLVDDVRTTGATALAAAQALHDAGADKVLLVTLAVAGQDALRGRRSKPLPVGQVGQVQNEGDL